MGRRGAVLAGVLACACGGDDGGAGGRDALRVVEVTPADSATGVEPDAPVVIRFDRDVDPETLDGSVLIRDTPAELVADGATVTFSPNEPLGYLQEYEVVVRTGARGLDGAFLATEHRSVFTTRFRTWETRRYLGDGAVGPIFGSGAPQLAGLPDGRVVALWQHGADGAFRVSWSVYQPGDDAWSPRALLGQSTMEMEPQLASSGAGEILAVWLVDTSVMSARYDPASDTFEVPDPVHVDEGRVVGPAVALSSNGNTALVIDTPTGLHVYRRSAGGGWSGDPLGQGSEAAVAAGDDGTVWAAWFDGEGLTARVFDGLSWGDPEPLWSDGAASVSSVRLARWPSNGGAIATWGVMRPDGHEVHVRAHQFGDWSAGEIIGRASMPASTSPDIATGPFGEVLVAWTQAGELHARWWRDRSWQPVATLADDLGRGAGGIAIDGDGNAIVTYSTDRAAYYLAVEDRWIESQLPLDTDSVSAAFSGSDPVVIGEQPTADVPHVVTAGYR